MHVHGTHLDPNALNPYSAAAAEKSAAAKRAAEVREKLMSSTGEMEDELDAGKVFPIAKQAQQNSRQPPGRKRPHPETPDEDADADDADTEARAAAEDDSSDDPNDPDDPMSLWG